MRAGVAAILALVVLAAIALFVFVDFNVTDEGSMPDVDVSVEGGDLPNVETQTGDIEVGEEQVTVPTVDVQTPDEQAAEEAAGEEDTINQ